MFDYLCFLIYKSKMLLLICFVLIIECVFQELRHLHKYADQILVVSDGNIIERGNHSFLMKLNGTYAHMVSLQS